MRTFKTFTIIAFALFTNTIFASTPIFQSYQQAQHLYHYIPVATHERVAYTDSGDLYHFQFRESFSSKRKLYISDITKNRNASFQYARDAFNVRIDKNTGRGCLIENSFQQNSFLVYPFYQGILGPAQKITIDGSYKGQKVSQPSLAYSPDGKKLALFYKITFRDPTYKEQLVASTFDTTTGSYCPTNQFGLRHHPSVIKDLTNYRIHHSFHDNVVLNDGSFITIDQTRNRSNSTHQLEFTLKQFGNRPKTIATVSDDNYNPKLKHPKVTVHNNGFVLGYIKNNNVIHLSFWNKTDNQYDLVSNRRIEQIPTKRCPRDKKFSQYFTTYGMDSNQAGDTVISTRINSAERKIRIQKFDKYGIAKSDLRYPASVTHPNYGCNNIYQYIYLSEEDFPKVSINNHGKFAIVSHLRVRDPQTLQSSKKHLTIRFGK